MNERFKPHKKTFEVEQPKKKFEPHSGKKFDVKKRFNVEEGGQQQEQVSDRFQTEGETGAEMTDDRFTINNINFEGRQISWAKQKGANSCGFCAIHDLSNFEDFDYEGSPDSIVDVINEIRGSNDGVSSLSRGERLFTGDISQYFMDKGYEVFNYLDAQDKNDASERMNSGNFNFICLSSGDHFTMFTKNEEGNYLLLDSLTTQPIEVSFEELSSSVNNSLDRNEQVMFFSFDEVEDGENHEQNEVMSDDQEIRRKFDIEGQNKKFEVQKRDESRLAQIRRRIFGR